MTTKTPEKIAEVLDKWDGVQIEHTEKAVRSVLKESFGDDVCDEDIKIALDLLEKQASPRKRRLATPDTDNMATRLLVWAEDEGVYLFGSDGEGFVRLPIGGHKEIWPVDSQQFRRFIIKLLFDREGKPPGPTALMNTIRLADALAVFERPQHKLHNRVAWHDGNLWFDLRNQEGEAVKVTAGEGWKITTPPILFRRYRHQKPAVTPVGVEDVQTILEKFLNIVNHDPKTRILHKVQIVFNQVPDVPHPISNLHGVQGSAKTCFSELLVKLGDPSIISTHVIPRKLEDLMQCLDHHWITVFDNISDLSDWQSDVFCRAVSGGGLQKRKHYTNDDDFFYSFKRVIVLNGINIAAVRPDLLDRTILHEFPSISAKSRITVEELWEKFNHMAPEVMGAIFTALSMAMKSLPTVQTSGLYRMADFTRWGIAIAEAIGHTGQDFLDEYAMNLKGANLQAIESSTVGTVLLELVIEYTAAGRDYIDTPKKVLKRLEEVAGTRVGSADWPANAQTLGRIMTNLKTNLERQGILFTRGVGKDREWTFSSIESPAQVTLVDYIPSEDEDDSEEGQPDNSDDTQTPDSSSQLAGGTDKKDNSGDSNIASGATESETIFGTSQSSHSAEDVVSSSQSCIDKAQPSVGEDGNDKDNTTSSANCEDSEDAKVNNEVLLEDTKPPKADEEMSSPIAKVVLPRTAKAFETWLKPLLSAGVRGFNGSDVRRAHGEEYLEQFSKYDERGWIEQRGDSKTWWISNTGEAALRGDP